MVFCNELHLKLSDLNFKVTILILVDGFLQSDSLGPNKDLFIVTILILVDGFLQLNNRFWREVKRECHNPYFSRWFSAIYSI